MTIPFRQQRCGVTAWSSDPDEEKAIGQSTSTGKRLMRLFSTSSG